MRIVLTVGFVVAVVLVGCDSVDYTQYVVARASASDRATIKRTVKASAAAAGLVDKTQTSTTQGTIALYVEPIPHFPVDLGARMVGGSAVIDLMCFHPGVGKPPAFQSAEFSLTTTLTREFGQRLTMPDYKHRVF